MPSDLSLSAARADRRTTLAWGVAGAVTAAVAATGCAPAKQPTTRRTVVSDDQDPDVTTALNALRDIMATQALLAGTSRRFPALRRQYRPLRTVLEAHRAQLAKAVPAKDTPTTPTTKVPRARAAAERRALRDVRMLQGQLVTHAMAAESGAFAQLLGSMSAGLAQQTAVL